MSAENRISQIDNKVLTKSDKNKTNNKNKNTNSDTGLIVDAVNNTDKYKTTDGYTQNSNARTKVYHDQYGDDKVISNIKNGTSVYASETYKNFNVEQPMYDLITHSIRGIYGAPYQFMPSVDRRINIDSRDTGMGKVSTFGRKYSEKIVSRMPLLFLTPGRPSFLDGFDKNSRGVVFEWMSDILKGSSVDNVEQILSKSGKFYTFKFAFAEYYRYVNSMLNTIAVLLGVGDETLPNGEGKDIKLRSFDWSEFNNTEFDKYFTSKESIVFYMDSENQISEDFQNDTTESSFGSTINETASTTREIQFLLGAGANIDSSGLINKIGSIGQTMSGIGNIQLLQSAADSLDVIAKGGKLVFPKYWSDSDFSRSYSINFKFRSPDNDSLSIFLNIIVPYIHLVCMAAPQSNDEGPNGLRSPFLVRGSYKGFFNCDMGIIRSLSCSKGAEGQWNNDGLPTVMDVQISLDDLYSNMAITDAYGEAYANPIGFLKSSLDQKNVLHFIQNTNLIDYLIMTSGLNANVPEISRTANVYIALAGNKFKNTPQRLFTQFEQSISNIIGGFFKRLKIKP